MKCKVMGEVGGTLYQEQERKEKYNLVRRSRGLLPLFTLKSNMKMETFKT